MVRTVFVEAVPVRLHTLQAAKPISEPAGHWSGAAHPQIVALEIAMRYPALAKEVPGMNAVC